MDVPLGCLEATRSHMETLTTEELRSFTVDGLRGGLHHLATIPWKPEDHVGLDRIIKLLKNVGCDINEITDEYVIPGNRERMGFTPLLVAIERKNLQFVECLLENGARLDISDGQGFLPLHWAVFVGDMGCFRKLVEAGALEAFSNLEGTNGVHPILHTAVDEGETEMVKYLLEHGLVSLKSDAKGSWFNELHYFILQGKVEFACQLLHQFAHEDLATDMIEDRWALHCLHSCAFGLERPSNKTIELVNAYVAAGWDINSVGKSTTRIIVSGVGANVREVDTEMEITLLHLACYFKSLELIKYLVEAGADVNAKTRGNDILYPLQVSILQEDWTSVEYLLANGADFHAVGGFKTVQDVDWVSEPGSRDLNLECHFTSLELLLQLGCEGGMAALEEMLKKGIPPPERIAFQRAVQGKSCEFVCKVVEQLCGAQNVKLEDLTWVPVANHKGQREYIPCLPWLILQTIYYSCYDVREETAKLVDVMGRFGYDFTLKLIPRSAMEWGYEEKPLIFHILMVESPWWWYPERTGLPLLETILRFDKVEVNVRNSDSLNPVEYVIHDWSSSDVQRKSAAVGLLIRSGVDMSGVEIGEGFRYFQGYLPTMKLIYSVGAKIEPDGFIPSVPVNFHLAAEVAALENANALAIVTQEIDKLKEWKKRFDNDRKGASTKNGKNCWGFENVEGRAARGVGGGSGRTNHGFRMKKFES